MILRQCRRRWWQRKGAHRAHRKCPVMWAGPYVGGSCSCDCHRPTSEAIERIRAQMQLDGAW